MSTPRISTEFDPFTLTVDVIIELSSGVTLHLPLPEGEVEEFLGATAMESNAGVTGLPPAQTVELPPKPAGGRSELT